VEMDTQNNIYGHKNMGANEVYDGDDIPLAKNALVFLAVGINDYWKILLGYFLIDSLTGLERSNLLLTCLEPLHETGTNVNSVTFDGTYVNGTMCTSLGANLTLENTSPFIENSDSKNKVKLFLTVMLSNKNDFLKMYTFVGFYLLRCCPHAEISTECLGR